MSKQTVLITMDAEPNTLRNRLIRIVQHWDLVTKYKRTDRAKLYHIIYVVLGDVYHGTDTETHAMIQRDLQRNRRVI